MDNGFMTSFSEYTKSGFRKHMLCIESQELHDIVRDNMCVDNEM